MSKTTDKKGGATQRMAVVGMGYVGLPLAEAFADAGFIVTGLDISVDKCKHINSGRSVTPDVSDESVKRLIDSGQLEASTDFSAVSDVDLISICVPTPLSKSKDPDISYIVKACESLLPHVRKGTVVVLESTTYPGTTRDVILERFEWAGFELGKDIHLAFSPERVDPGNETWNIRNTPKVLGGLTPECGERAREFYAQALETVILVSSAEAAEMVKLLENTFRAINIGLVNELCMVCEKLGLNSWEIIDAAATKPFGFLPFRPGPGLGGHCIPIDPLYLSWKMRTMDYKVRFIELADEVNSFMPRYVVGRVQDLLNEQEKALKGSRVLILGMAYKADVDDVRESPALDLYKILSEMGARIEYHDPHVASFRFGKETIKGVGLDAALGEPYDLILVATGHRAVDYDAFADRGIPLLDTRNQLGHREDAHVHLL